MGGDLDALCPAVTRRRRFAVWAVKDFLPSGQSRSYPDRQGLTKSGQSFEKMFDVAWAGSRAPDKWTGVVPSIGTTVDLEKATYANSSGAVELKVGVDRPCNSTWAFLSAFLLRPYTRGSDATPD